jgi:multiple sugar transport system permease protein
MSGLMDVRTASRLRALSRVSFAVLMLTLALAFTRAIHAVRTAGDDLLLAEAAMAVELWSVGGAPALDRFAPGRWTMAVEAADDVDRPEIHDGDGVGRVARAALYDDVGWSTVGTLTLRPDRAAAAPVPWVMWLVVLSSLVAVTAAVGWWVEDLGPGRRFGPPVTGAGMLLSIVFAGQWADTHLVDFTELRLAAAAQALHIGLGADPPVMEPGAVARLTGLPALRRAVGGGVEATTLLPGVAQDLVALPAPPPSRTVVQRVPYAVRDEGSFRLSTLPMEHAHTPWPGMLGIFLAGMLLAALPATLAPVASRPRELRRNLWAWSFLAPAGAHLAVFTLGPLAFAAWLSLHRWNLVDAARPFVGLGNYLDLLRDGAFWNAIANTALFTLHVPVAMAVALGFALLVHKRTPATTLVRTALFLPSITSLVAIAIVWQWILNDDYGILNWLLGQVGVAPVRWLTSPRTALLSIMLLSTWIVVGYQMVLFQAGLAAIPRELYEAARIDGAGPLQRFRHVTLPGLRHTLFFVLVTSVIGSFQIFGAVYVMTEGGPLGATDVAVYHIYKEAWEFLRFGSAAAQSWVLFAIIFSVTWLHFRFLERRADEGVPARHGGAP